MDVDETGWVEDCWRFYTSKFDRPPTAIELWDWKREHALRGDSTEGTVPA